ncbi:30S ribosomal protein S16 [Patescibacteria group bacterium]
MLMIKFARIGKKKQPTYRIVILEKSKDPYGKSLEILGNYNPRDKKCALKEDRIKYWISKGAQATDTVHNLLVSQGIIDAKKIKSYKISQKRKKKIEEKNKNKKGKLDNLKVSEEKPEKPVESEKEKSAEEVKAPETKSEEPKTEEQKTEEVKEEEIKPATEKSAEPEKVSEEK